MFLAFNGTQFNDFSVLRFFNHLKLDVDPTEPAVTVLARFEDDWPAMVEARIGDGKLIVWPFAVQLSWTNLPKTARFDGRVSCRKRRVLMEEYLAENGAFSWNARAEKAEDDENDDQRSHNSGEPLRRLRVVGRAVPRRRASGRRGHATGSAPRGLFELHDSFRAISEPQPPGPGSLSASTQGVGRAVGRDVGADREAQEGQGNYEQETQVT